MASTHLIVIGAQKAGTTWLHQTLDANKGFFLPVQPQEIHFFDKEWDSGFEYYLDLYRNARQDEITVDVTPDYLYDPEVPRRIKYFADQTGRVVEFIVSIREPLARMRSAYLMKRETGAYSDVPDIETAIHRDTALFEKSCYAPGIRRFINAFEKKHLLVFLYEELFVDTCLSLDRISNHLGLDRALKGHYEGIPINQAKRNSGRSAFLNMYGRNLKHLIRKQVGSSVWHALKRMKLSMNKREHIDGQPIITDKEENILQGYRRYFEDDVATAAKLINRPDLQALWGYQ